MNSLNEYQKQAVTAPVGNTLVLAGAGSGKTRVLVQRIVWLVENGHFSPHNILAVTFTNKASKEMSSRIEQALNSSVQGMWLGTFHSLAHKLLRSHWHLAGLEKNFQIIDSDDQARLIKRIVKQLNLDEEQWVAKKIQWYINGKKENGVRPWNIPDENDMYAKTMVKIYLAYEELCKQSNLIDFSELLLRSFELWRDNPALLMHYKDRFKYILVDEFQDTNAIQYQWIKLLAGDENNVMIVGDDDQSIYGWRGACSENIQRFCRDFNNATTIRLEQNYRSTGNILKAANSLISNNGSRLGKNLWSAGEDGEPIYVYKAFNDIDESKFIASSINSWSQKGYARREMAILYRSNAQSRVIEESLVRANIPYVVYGGMRFFERAEVKDALSYCRLLINSKDNNSFERVVNHPTRGIGNRTLFLVREYASKNNLSLWDSSVEICKEQSILTPRASQSLLGFIELINSIKDDISDLKLSEVAEMVVKQSGLLSHYKNQKGEKALSKVENLAEFVNATKNFSSEEDENDLFNFLSHAALESGENQADKHDDCVQLMTLHSAKGLEFPIVYISGLEEGLFPHPLAIEESGRLEEERRLCYVGMTRAKKQLYISYAEIRRHFGKEQYHKVSRFINEIPKKHLAEVRQAQRVSRPMQQRVTPKPNYKDLMINGFSLGQNVTHPKFGHGVILGFEGSGDATRVEVQFYIHGTKWLVLSFANLSAMQS